MMGTTTDHAQHAGLDYILDQRAAMKLAVKQLRRHLLKDICDFARAGRWRNAEIADNAKCRLPADLDETIAAIHAVENITGKTDDLCPKWFNDFLAARKP